MSLPSASAAEVRAYLRDRLRPHRARIVTAVVCIFVATSAGLASPLLVRHAIDDGVRRGDVGVVDDAALGIAVVAVLAAMAARVRVLSMARVSEALLATLRDDAFARTVDLPVADVEGERQGALLSRLTDDVTSLSVALRDAGPELARGAALFTMSLIVLVVLSPPLAACLVVAVPVLAWSVGWFRRRSAVVYAAFREAHGLVLAEVSESLAGARVTQAYGRVRVRQLALRPVLGDAIDTYLDGSRLRNRFFPTLTVAKAVVTAGLLVAGAAMERAGWVSVGTVAAFLLSLTNLFGPIEELTEWFNELISGGASLRRVVGLIEMPSSIAEPSDPVPLPERGALDVEAVAFAYPGGPEVLRDLSVTIAPGERLALVGPTGAGKSTLARLLARTADPVAGVVRFGGVDLRATSLAQVRARIVTVPQEVHVFTGTVAENVTLAHPGLGPEAAAVALERIGARQWAESLPDGLETEVLAAGAGLSAGERQLLSLARVALVDPAVVILDEATADLDPGTAALVERALERLLAGRTVVVIAHRMATAARCDRVGVVDRGRLVEVGPPEELIAAGGRFAALWAASIGHRDESDDDLVEETFAG